jgi:hypothetical protein
MAGSADLARRLGKRLRSPAASAVSKHSTTDDAVLKLPRAGGGVIATIVVSAEVRSRLADLLLGVLPEAASLQAT